MLPPSTLRSRQGKKHRSSGVALVIVLLFVIPISVTVIAFLTRSSSERLAASGYSEAIRSGFLADTAVNIVRTQISTATNDQDGNRSAAWASQPGMIRSFASDGGLLRGYKLYSDSEMVVDSIDLDKAKNSMASWWSAPALYVDLNAPVPGAQAGELIYPILDNATLESFSQEANGFSVTGAPVNSSDINASNQPRQRIPMPVKWLYVLQDGTAVAPTGSGSAVTVPGATLKNPIVGRIAFWTDDETSKLNINTASHGTFWDTPRVSTIEDRDRMARFQPARNEFQRFPGHPAMTSLRPAFDSTLFPDDDAFARFAYGITPRISDGGSEAGTKKALQAVTLDRDRLYSSVDELLFAPDRTEQLQVSDIRKAKFFLTARSNAPEVNLFNLPRVAIWPINSGSKIPSTTEKLITLSSTINGDPYYLQRSNPSSSSEDITAFNGRNMDLWNYINFLLTLPPPSFGSTSFADKYTRPEAEQITTEIFDYIRSSNLYSTALGATAYTGDVNVVPASLSPRRKPGTRVGQVTPMKVKDTKGFGRLPTITRAVLHLYISGADILSPGGEVVRQWRPTFNGATPRYTADTAQPYQDWKSFLSGFGAAGTGAKLKLLTTGILYFDTFDPNLGYTIPRYHFEVDTEFYGAWSVEGIAGNNVSLGAESLGFSNKKLKINLDQNQLYNSKTNRTNPFFMPRVLGGALGPQWMMQNYSDLEYPDVTKPKNSVTSVVDGFNYGKTFTDKGIGYPLVSRRVGIHQPVTPLETSPGVFTLPNLNSIPANERTPTIRFSGGGVRVKIIAGGPNGNGGEVVQSYDFSFPPFTKPAPAYLDDNTRAQGNVFKFDKDKQFPISADFRHRWSWAHYEHGFYYPQGLSAGGSWAERDYPDLRIVQDGDVAVSLVSKHGDKRLLAAKSELDSTDFREHEFYFDETKRGAVDFRFDMVGLQALAKITPGSATAPGGPGRILNLPYGRNALPDMPGHLRDGVQLALGLSFPPDFDNAPFFQPDDAYINRADEGSVKDEASGTGSNVTNDREIAWYLDSANAANNQDDANFFSPGRQMPSPVMFGSLPTGVKRNRPWQTLLFRPDPGGHPGADGLPDFTLLDLFWMPVAEPYPISERFSTNGKVNMNYQIMPFTYIKRATALYGVLTNQEILAIPNSAAGSGTDNGFRIMSADDYKAYSPNASDHVFSSGNYRRKVDIAETLKGFAARLDGGELFRTEAEICTLPIIPVGASYRADFENWWKDYQLTGDNSREKIYAELYPRLTTRSNTYTVHYIAQSLKQPRARTDAEASVWNEARGSVTSESRGLRTIERYIDPSDPNIPDYATTLQTTPDLSRFYKWREIATREY